MQRAYVYRINSLMNKLVLYILKIYRGDVLISYSSKQLNIIRKIKYKHISLEYDGTHIHKVIIRTLWNSARKKQQKKKKKKEQNERLVFRKQVTEADIFFGYFHTDSQSSVYQVVKRSFKYYMFFFSIEVQTLAVLQWLVNMQKKIFTLHMI